MHINSLLFFMLAGVAILETVIYIIYLCLAVEDANIKKPIKLGCASALLFAGIGLIPYINNLTNFLF